MSLLKFQFKIFKTNVLGNRELILEDTVQRTRRHCKYVLAGTLLGLTAYSFYPLYDCIINGNLTLISPLQVPFVDSKSVGGFLFLQVLNVCVVLWSHIFSFTFNCVLLSFVDAYDGLVYLMEDDFKTFDIMWEIKGRFTEKERQTVFRNLTMELIDLAQYVDGVIDRGNRLWVFSRKNFVILFEA